MGFKTIEEYKADNYIGSYEECYDTGIYSDQFCEDCPYNYTCSGWDSKDDE